jgi:(p)ppGpp synthase/HD superfamily hydrolase
MVKQIWSQEIYLQAWQFAAQAHQGQQVPGTDLPYIFHIGAVAMEIVSALARGRCVDDPDLAVQCALLHDVIEDTSVTYELLVEHFGVAVADGVQALSKDPHLPSKAEQMADSLHRIRQQPREVWMVKLADRIVNLQPPPPHWSKPKIVAYRQEAIKIVEVLGPADDYLAARLQAKIAVY